LLQCPYQGGSQVTGALKPLVRVFRERPSHDAVELSGDFERWRLALQDRRNHTRRALSGERPSTREKFVQHATEAEQIAARIDLLVLQLLRRHVLERPYDLRLDREHSCVVIVADANGLRRQSEVEQFDPLFGNEDISGFQVPMSDAFLMRRVKGHPESGPRIRPPLRAGEVP
jgi:hypothetical protein